MKMEIISKTMDVVVHKATVALMGDESVDSYCRKVSDAAVSHVKMKLNFAKDNSNGSWPVEVYGDKMIVAAYKGNDKTRYYAFKYTRDKNGTFSFDNLTEVERKTVYQPVNPMASVNKAETCVENAKSLSNSDKEKTCGDKVKKSTGLKEFGDWIETSKNFWHGVL